MNDTYGTTTGIQLCFNYIIGFSFNTVICNKNNNEFEWSQVQSNYSQKNHHHQHV